MTQDKRLSAALDFHRYPRPGKIAICASKPLGDAESLSLAYSPGVAEPVEAIMKNPDAVYDYTGKGNLVAVLTNGTAVLGMGDVGVAAAKPVMEGKAALFKRFADIDAIDIGLQTKDPVQFVETAALISGGFGGINLEDIAAPACFAIERDLQAKLDIPVFHDDQHGTAVVVLAGLLNACWTTDRHLDASRIVINGAGAAALACAGLLRDFGVPAANIVVCDLWGVVHTDREVGMDLWKAEHATSSAVRTLAEALVDADIFIGLSAGNVLGEEHLLSMRAQPIIFAMANPVPEVDPAMVHRVLDRAVMATGRSDYPNQVNNLLCFPFLFRGALDVRATRVTLGMKLAAAKCMAELARNPLIGAPTIVPNPFDSRLFNVAVAVAMAAVDDGVAQKPIVDWDSYRSGLAERLAAPI